MQAADQPEWIENHVYEVTRVARLLVPNEPGSSAGIRTEDMVSHNLAKRAERIVSRCVYAGGTSL